MAHFGRRNQKVEGIKKNLNYFLACEKDDARSEVKR